MFSWLRAPQDSLSVSFCYRTLALKRSHEVEVNMAPADIKNSLVEREWMLYTVSVEV